MTSINYCKEIPLTRTKRWNAHTRSPELRFSRSMIDDGAFNLAKETFSSSVTSQPRSQGSFLSLANVCCVNHFFLLAQTSKHARLMLCIITLTTHWCVNMAHLFLLVTSKLFYKVHNKIIISINPVAIKVKGNHVFKTAPRLQKHEDEKCKFAIKLW